MNFTRKQIGKAIKGSIRKWWKIMWFVGKDKGVQNCPLCCLFRNQKDECKGCPIRLVTGRRYCINTPYSNYSYRKGIPWLNAIKEYFFLKRVYKVWKQEKL